MVLLLPSGPGGDLPISPQIRSRTPPIGLYLASASPLSSAPSAPPRGWGPLCRAPLVCLGPSVKVGSTCPGFPPLAPASVCPSSRSCHPDGAAGWSLQTLSQGQQDLGSGIFWEKLEGTVLGGGMMVTGPGLMLFHPHPSLPSSLGRETWFTRQQRPPRNDVIQSSQQPPLAAGTGWPPQPVFSSPGLQWARRSVSW